MLAGAMEAVDPVCCIACSALPHSKKAGAGMRYLLGNPYAGHILAETVEQVGILTGRDESSATVMVHHGYIRWGNLGRVRYAHSAAPHHLTLVQKLLPANFVRLQRRVTLPYLLYLFANLFFFATRRAARAGLR